ncbi:MAG: hypothetical protein ACK4QW_06565 [Alphaproteobacteria bacterium]
MDDPADALVLDLVEWVAAKPRSYGEVMEAWRTSCPRLTVWENALDRGLLIRRTGPDGRSGVAVTPAGFATLERAGRRGAPVRASSAFAVPKQ